MQYTVTFFYQKKKKKNESFIGQMGFFIFAQNIHDCGYMLKPPRLGGSNKYLQVMFWIKN